MTSDPLCPPSAPPSAAFRGLHPPRASGWMAISFEHCIPDQLPPSAVWEDRATALMVNIMEAAFVSAYRVAIPEDFRLSYFFHTLPR